MTANPKPQQTQGDLAAPCNETRARTRSGALPSSGGA